MKTRALKLLIQGFKIFEGKKFRCRKNSAFLAGEQDSVFVCACVHARVCVWVSQLQEACRSVSDVLRIW